MKPVLGLILRNLQRRPGRALILILCVAAAAGLQVAAAVVDGASRRGLELGLERLGADLVAVPRGLNSEVEQAYLSGTPALFYMDNQVEKKIADHDFVSAVSSQLFLKSLSQASCCSNWNVFLVGFDPKTDFTVRPWLGDDLDRPLAADEVLVGAAMGAEPGAPLKFFGSEFKVAGKLEATGMGLDAAVFIPLEGAYRMAADSARLAEKTLDVDPGKISAVLIRLKPVSQGGLPAYRAAFNLEQDLPEITILQPDDLVVRTHHNLAGALTGLRSAGYALWAVTAVLIALIFAMAAQERRREIGLLRALGAGRGSVFGLIVGEALLITAAGAALGIGSGLGLTKLFAQLIALSLETPFRFPDGNALLHLGIIAAALALLTGAAAVLIPAGRAALMEPYESIRRAD